MFQKIIFHLKYLLCHPHHLFFYPYQGIWNTYTNKIPVLRHLFILADTAWLWLRTNSKSQDKTVTKGKKIIFLDIGLHLDPIQSKKMLEWFGHDYDLTILGFEAHPTYFKKAQHSFRNFLQMQNMSGLPFKFFNIALVGPNQKDISLKLYQDGETGKGDSLLEGRGNDYVDVKTGRLSEILKKEKIDIENDVLLLRMNIEGAELFVIEDIIDSGLQKHINGFFGMWDDLYKMAPEKDKEFRQLLQDNNIQTTPFNDRDLASKGRFMDFSLKWREKVIKQAIEASF